MRIRITDDQSDHIVNVESPRQRTGLGFVGTRVIEAMRHDAEITEIVVTRMPGCPIRTTTYTREK